MNLTREESITTSAGMSVGGYADISMVMAEKVRSERIMTGMKMKRFKEMLRKIPIIEIRDVIIKPKYKEACISPNSTVVMETGVEINLSNVLLLASQGIIVGPTAVEVKNAVIEIRATKRYSCDKFLPMRKAPNRKKGNKSPIITTGPFR